MMVSLLCFVSTCYFFIECPHTFTPIQQTRCIYVCLIKVQLDTKTKTDHHISPPWSDVLSLLHLVAWMIVRSASIFSLELEIEPLKPIHYTLHTDGY